MGKLMLAAPPARDAFDDEVVELVSALSDDSPEILARTPDVRIQALDDLFDAESRMFGTTSHLVSHSLQRFLADVEVELMAAVLSHVLPGQRMSEEIESRFLGMHHARLRRMER